MNIGAVIIGDEILSGRRQDRHFAKLIELLRNRGLALSWCAYLGDDRARLTAFFRTSFASGDLVFSFGGIGNTPDDHTRQAAAAALGVPLELHADAKREIEGRFGAEVTRQRLAMGEFPRGARIIPNPYNRIPGFSVGDHHFVPGFPEMAWPMAEWVLDTHYAGLRPERPRAEAAVVVYEVWESALMELMQRIEREHAGLRVFSLPSFGDERVRRHVELGVRGEAGQVEAAMAEIRAELDRIGLHWEPSAAATRPQAPGA
ncbi:MAG: competence/damage-inducible protein A [Betaproteobacteria bacterium CG2_30_68_42]|nr:MAG: competence/damage-inducible protein A [Betaproteobacteria bacterium CG2_30_68_42]PJA57365.1 MAG: competence/damage-inducible protein A [Rhodocyclales bacterium CG_4_9_14_3_um_filter_68_10]